MRGDMYGHLSRCDLTCFPTGTRFRMTSRRGRVHDVVMRRTRMGREEAFLRGYLYMPYVVRLWSSTHHVLVDVDRVKADFRMTSMDDADVSGLLVADTDPVRLEAFQSGDGAHCGLTDWYLDGQVALLLMLRQGPDVVWTTGWYGSKKEIASGCITASAVLSIIRNATSLNPPSMSNAAASSWRFIQRMP